MSELPNDRLYSQSHEWIQRDGDSLTVGVTDHAQESLGDLVFVELPEAGETLSAGDAAAVVESVKAASDIYAPVDGEVVAINEQLADAPELVNEDPYGEGWLMKLTFTDESALAGFMDAEAYQNIVDEEEG